MTGSTTKSSSDTAREDADDLRDTARDTAREGREEARDIRESTRDTADDLRDEARENQLETRGSSEAERQRSQDLRESARETAREGREEAGEVRRSAFDDADDFRDAARDSNRDAPDADSRDDDTRSDDPDRDATVERDSALDRDRRADLERRDDRAEFNRRDSARSDVDVRDRTSAEFDRRNTDVRSDSRFSSDARVDSRRSDSRFSSDSRLSSDTRTSSEFRVNDIRSADVGLWFDRSTSDGLIISDIGTGAINRFGFREGDRIYSVNGVRVDSETDFVRTLFDPQWRGQRVNVIIYRHGRPWTVYVQPQLLVQEYTTVAYDPLEDWGLVLDDRYDDYVVVWRVTPRSPAFYAGLRPGDVITTFQGRRLTGRDDFVRLVGQGGLRDVALDVTRNRQLRRIDLDLSGVGAPASTRTSLRPDFDAASGVRTDVDVDAGLRSGIDTGVRSNLDTGVRAGTGSRFDNTTIDGRLEGRVDNTLDRVQERDMFPNSTQGGMVPQGTLRGNAGGGARGTIQPGNVRPGVGGAIRSGGGILGGRRN